MKTVGLMFFFFLAQVGLCRAGTNGVSDGERLLVSAQSGQPESLLPLSPSKSRAIFREISLGRSGTIVLGGPSSSLPLESNENSPIKAVRKGSFGGAKAIKVELSESGTVVAVLFEYSEKIRFADLLRSYTKTLGEPSATNTETLVSVARWEDGVTVFEIRGTTEGPNHAAKAILSDKSKLGAVAK